MPEFPPSRLLEYSNKFMSGAAIFDPKILRSKNPINSQHRQLAFRRFSTGRSASVFPTTIAGFAHTRTTPNYAQFLDLSTTLAQYPNAIWKRRNSARRTDRPCDNRRLSRKTDLIFSRTDRQLGIVYQASARPNGLQKHYLCCLPQQPPWRASQRDTHFASYPPEVLLAADVHVHNENV